MADSPRRRRKLTRELVADAALEVGFEQLTMSRVAERLGVTHPALYHHVADRSDLVRLAADRVAAQVEWPPLDADWVAHLRAEAIVIFGVMVRHPGLLAALEEADVIAEAVATHLGDVNRHLLELGFEAEAAFLAVDLVVDLAGDSAQRAVQLLRRDESGRQRLDDLLARTFDGDLGEVMAQALADGPWRWFERKLDVVLAGIEARLGPNGPADR
ncbi:MAG: TetR family transcriptional regulator [Actinomycetota bacterium]